MSIGVCFFGVLDEFASLRRGWSAATSAKKNSVGTRQDHRLSPLGKCHYAIQSLFLFSAIVAMSMVVGSQQASGEQPGVEPVKGTGLQGCPPILDLVCDLDCSRSVVTLGTNSAPRTFVLDVTTGQAQRVEGSADFLNFTDTKQMIAARDDEVVGLIPGEPGFTTLLKAGRKVFYPASRQHDFYFSGANVISAHTRNKFLRRQLMRSSSGSSLQTLLPRVEAYQVGRPYPVSDGLIVDLILPQIANAPEGQSGNAPRRQPMQVFRFSEEDLAGDGINSISELNRRGAIKGFKHAEAVSTGQFGRVLGFYSYDKEAAWHVYDSASQRSTFSVKAKARNRLAVSRDETRFLIAEPGVHCSEISLEMFEVSNNARSWRHVFGVGAQ